MDPFGVTANTGYVPQHAPQSTSPGSMPGIGRSTGPAASTQGTTSLVSLRNPLTWFAIFAATTFGLIGFSSTARVGKARGKVSLGKE
jgi:hypothetical protein